MSRSTLLVAALLAPLLPGCATTALWGGTIADGDLDGSYEVRLAPRVDGAADATIKILLSPVAAAVDICTSPVQAVYYGWDTGPFWQSLFEDGGVHCLFD